MNDNEVDETCLLSFTFVLYPKKTTAQVILTNKKISIENDQQKNKTAEIILLDDIIGCHVLEGNRTTGCEWYLCIFSYPMKKKLFKGMVRHRLARSLGVGSSKNINDSKDVAEKWKRVIKYLISGKTLTKAEVDTVPELSPRKYTVYVNPFSGQGKALQMYNGPVRAMLAEAEINHKMIKTEYGGHARKMVKDLNLAECEGIIIVSGDGLVHEVINGLMERPDWEKAIKTPIGIVPGGSGNALAASVIYASTGQEVSLNILRDSLFEITRGRTRDMALMYAEMRDRSFYSFLNCGWGFVADVDIESEKYRYLGKARFTVGCAIRVANLRKYNGMISYLPVDDPSTFSLNHKRENSGCESRRNSSNRYVSLDPPVLKGRNENTNQSNANGTSFMKPKQLTRKDAGDGKSCGDHELAFDGQAPIIEHSERTDHIVTSTQTSPYHLKTTLVEPLPEGWLSLEDDFVWIMPVYLSHIGHDMLAMPASKMEEEVIYLYCLKSTVSKLELTKVLLGFENGTHLVEGGPNTVVIPCKAFRLEPFSSHTNLLTVDGELIPHDPLQACCTPVKARVISSTGAIN